MEDWAHHCWELVSPFAEQIGKHFPMQIEKGFPYLAAEGIA